MSATSFPASSSFPLTGSVCSIVIFAGSRCLQHSASRILRSLQSRESIADTKSLIDALNGTTDDVERKLLREWLRNYVKWFAKQPIECITVEEANEYALLGQIKVLKTCDSQLLGEWFVSLCNKIKDEWHGEKKIIDSMETALLSIDKRVFEGDPTGLLNLATQFLARLKLRKTVFNRATYKTHRATLSALNQTLVIIKQISRHILNPWEKNGYYQTFKKDLEKILKHQKHYPIEYQVRLILQSIQRLESQEDLSSSLARIIGRAYHGAVGTLCIIEGVKAIVTGEYKHDAFQEGIQNLRTALESVRIEQKLWYEWIGDLNCAALQVLKNPLLYHEFEEVFDALKQNLHSFWRRKDYRDLWTRETCRALSFGMIDQLEMLIARSDDQHVRSEALSMLLDFGKAKEPGKWISHKGVLEALLDACCDVYGLLTEEQRDDVEKAVTTMDPSTMVSKIPFKKAVLKKVYNDWHDGKSTRDRLRADMVEKDLREGDRLFQEVKTEIGLIGSPKDVAKLQEELKVFYRSSEFCEVSASLCFQWNLKSFVLRPSHFLRANRQRNT